MESQSTAPGELYLTHAERNLVPGTVQNAASGSGSKSLNLLGKVFTSKNFNLHALRNSLKLAWKLRKGFVVREIQTNLLSFQFSCLEDFEKVLTEGPWTFDRQLLILKDVGNQQPSKVHFDSEWFWIRIQDLPFTATTSETAMALGGLFKDYHSISEEQLLKCSGSMRLHVLIDVTTALRRGALLNLQDHGKIWVNFQYEKLPNFCYICGRLGHIQIDCEDVEARQFENQYGPWLRAPPLARILSASGETNSDNSAIPKDCVKGNRCLLDALLQGHDDNENLHSTSVLPEQEMNFVSEQIQICVVSGNLENSANLETREAQSPNSLERMEAQAIGLSSSLTNPITATTHITHIQHTSPASASTIDSFNSLNTDEGKQLKISKKKWKRKGKLSESEPLSLSITGKGKRLLPSTFTNPASSKKLCLALIPELSAPEISAEGTDVPSDRMQ